ncbi:MAG: CHAD domain-containing protein [Chlorobium sp.]
MKQANSSEPLPENPLPPGWRCEKLSMHKERRVFYDTFSWQVFEKGVVMVKKKNTLSLLDLDTGYEKTSLFFSKNPSYFFSDSLPPGKARQTLSSYSSIRAFVRLCSIDALTHSYRILDDNEKTVAILVSESLSLVSKKKHEPFAHLFSIRALKGYQKEMQCIEKSLAEHQETESSLDFRDLFLLIMNVAGCRVKEYSPKIHLHLEKNAIIQDSVRQLLQATLTIIRQNETGIRKDIDSEFLHDYRVAIRRTRSILKQLKGVFDKEETAYYLNAFRELGKRSNKLRDCDVYLLRQQTCFHYLPPLLRPSLKLFFSDIALSREALHKQFSRYLASDACHSFFEKWESFVNRKVISGGEQPPDATLSTLAVAVSSIKKAWKKVIRTGRRIGPEATDGELHTLRIECKKLRYLLEFFSSLFPIKTIAPVIRQLKELQENLGNFVDFAIQLNLLHQRLESIQEQSGEILPAASTGGLMATFYQKQEEARQKFHEKFRDFDNAETARLFENLIKEQ